MGERGFNRQWAREFESRFGQRHGGDRGGDWGGDWGGRWGSWQWGPQQRPSGPPPWLAGLFGLAGHETAPQQRGPRVRRGDVRVAILDVLAEEPLNGYQVIGQIADRTNGAWRPSPGSVYPTISQLEDEGLVESDDERGRRTLRLTEAGRDYLATHEAEVAEVWAPFAGEKHRAEPDSDDWDFASLKPELGRVMNAVWQIITTGSERQRREAVGVLVEARRSLYTILADDPGDTVGDAADDADEESPDDGEGRAEGAE